MQIYFTDRFKKQYQALPEQIQKRTDKKLALLLNYPQHPSLRLHKMRGHKNMWEIRITASYRIVFQIIDDAYRLERIGSHDILGKK
ncbi:MAG: type II toxin-antitoxin system mRNA interferase toxin, RelE/StbE family [Candidatus Omnitrophica bacterium]|nr:type II toxin-antitoxin system mRNA interferase toxin, RelE/StbE family [Candidatus Omnitrophota bacterium]